VTRMAASSDPRRMLDLDPVTIRKARSLARKAGAPVVSLAKRHTTVSVERAVLRLSGLEGADVEGIPWVNRLADCVSDQVGLQHGVALPVWDALAAQRRAGIGGDTPLLTLAQRAAAGSVQFRVPEGRAAASASTAALRSARAGVRKVDRQRAARERLLARYPVDHKPWAVGVNGHARRFAHLNAGRKPRPVGRHVCKNCQ